MTSPRPRLRLAGLDLGTTHVKAVGVELPAGDGGSLAVRSMSRVPTPATAPELVATALGLLQRVAAEGGPVGAIGIASMAETGVPLDEHDDPLTPLLTWNADRPTTSLERLARELDPADLFARTGVRLSAKVPLATWAWLADSQPDVRRRMRRWAGVADLVAHALTGRLATDHTLAGRTGAYPLAGTTFDPDLLALVGLDAAMLPEVAAAGEPVGSSNGVPVTVAGHDHRVGAHACGVRSPGDAANSVGTSEVVLRVLAGRPDPERVRAAGMSLVRTVAGDEAVLAGTGAPGTAYAAWLDEHDLRGQEAELLDEVLRLDPGPSDGAGPASRLKALLEQRCLQTRWLYDVQRDLDAAAPAPAPLTLLGGPGARNAAWTQLKADVLPGGLRVVTQDEPVAVGAAIIAAERAGLVAPGEIVLPAQPRPGRSGADYQQMYETFVREARRRETST